MPTSPFLERRVSLGFLLLATLAIFVIFLQSRRLSIPSLHRSDHGPRKADVASTEEASEPPPQTVDTPRLRFTPSEANFHVIISHYDEEPFYINRWTSNLRSVPFAQSLGVHVTLYTKAANPDLAKLEAVSGADVVIQLPNVGREGGTYLHHILTHYDDLPLFTMFTQAIIKKGQQEGSGPTAGMLQGWLDERLRTKFGNSTGFMSLDRKHDICYCGHCSDMGRDDLYPIWPQIYAMMEGRVCQAHEGSILSFNGHFIVSKKRILSRPWTLYGYLHDLVHAPEGHWIHDEPEPKWFEMDKGKSRPEDPKFGHTLERLWHQIFRCGNAEVVKDCDVGDMKAEGAGGCSCLDEVE